MGLEEIVRELADKESIRDLARRYAHCVWQRDADGAADLFAEDGVMDTGESDPLEGREAILTTYRATFAAAEFRPFVHNHVVELDGDRASGTCYLDLRAMAGETPMTGYGYYDDEYVRVGGEWKFKRRKLNMLRYEPESGAGG